MIPSYKMPNAMREVDSSAIVFPLHSKISSVVDYFFNIKIIIIANNCLKVVAVQTSC